MTYLSKIFLTCKPADFVLKHKRNRRSTVFNFYFSFDKVNHEATQDWRRKNVGKERDQPLSTKQRDYAVVCLIYNNDYNGALPSLKNNNRWNNNHQRNPRFTAKPRNFGGLKTFPAFLLLQSKSLWPLLSTRFIDREVNRARVSHNPTERVSYFLKTVALPYRVFFHSKIYSRKAADKNSTLHTFYFLSSTR